MADLHKAVSLGGEPRKRGKGKTLPGHLAPLMPLALASIDQDTIRDRYASEKSAHQFRLTVRWRCSPGSCRGALARKEYRGLVNRDCARASELGDVLPATKRRTDAIERYQLPAWFKGTDELRSRTAATYLQALVYGVRAAQR